MVSGLVDVHHHVVPDVYRTAFAAVTDGTIGGIPLPEWNEVDLLERIDTLGVQRAVVSISAPALEPVPDAERAELARRCNDALAELATRHQGSVGAFAVLPMPDVASSIDECRRVFTDGRFDGVAVLTNYGGVYLGDAHFAPLLAELNRHKAVGHVHPNVPPPLTGANLVLPAPVLEFTFDTTRMIAEMILAETLGRYPEVKLVLSHLGGTLPWVAWRLSMLDDFPSRYGGTREPVLSQLRRMYYDSALSADPAALRMASETIGADRLLYGSDFPFAPGSFIDRNRTSIDASLAHIMTDNAAELFG